MWNQFRQTEGMQGYYEPFNEILSHYNRADYAETFRHIKDQMHHPEISTPYFDNYPTDTSGRVVGYLDRFAYADYCLAEDDDHPAMQAYIDGLLARAGGRPVLKFCRSALRAGWLTRRYRPVNVFVLRNPRAQWQSYLSFAPGYFNAIGLLLSAHHADHPLLAPLASELGLPRYEGQTVDETVMCYQLLARHYDPARLYFAAYMLWCIDLLELLARADILVDMDHLSGSMPARDRLLRDLAPHGLTLKLDDCAIPTYGHYALPDAVMTAVEQYVHGLLQRHAPDRRGRLAARRDDFAGRLSEASSRHLGDLLETADGAADRPSPFELPAHRAFDQAFQGMVDELNRDRHDLLDGFGKHTANYETRMKDCQDYAHSLEEYVKALEANVKALDAALQANPLNRWFGRRRTGA